ncbi:ABC transporter ATP-binding protein [Geodermatophilus sp. CPCC 205506]|uniref:ABC transporter ATP-binding protein n=1 Tax=Geodermatophilus sp. CPCC 205506 TaxID=2936596 RepID=UPI003EEF4840
MNGTTASGGALLEIEDLRVHFATPAGVAEVVNGVSLRIEAGTVHGLVGESGSGKSVTSRSVLGLLPRRSLVRRDGAVRFAGRDLFGLSEEEMGRDIRGRQIAMVFQDPMTALNPVMRIGHQIAMPLRLHKGLSRRQARDTAVELLRQVGIPHPEARLRAYPHELSGGQRQRVMIAIALSCDPQLLIADEPTTALDVTVQAQILDLFDRLREERGLAILLVSHDLGLIAERCDEVSVMYAGRVVESGPAEAVFDAPEHPYTRLLEQARPRLENPPHTLLKTISGRPPRLVDLPPGCSFRDRCPRAGDDCAESFPPLTPSAPGRSVACLRPHDLLVPVAAGSPVSAAVPGGSA